MLIIDDKGASASFFCFGLVVVFSFNRDNKTLAKGALFAYLKVSFSLQKCPFLAIFCLLLLIVVNDALFKGVSSPFLDLFKIPNDTTKRNFCFNHTIRSVLEEKDKADFGLLSAVGYIYCTHSFTLTPYSNSI